MHCKQDAARWKQSVETQLKTCNWQSFTQMILDRFGRNEHEILIRRLFHIDQSGPVADYITDFSRLLDQLTAYAPHPDPLYYTQRFIDGLRSDIKSVVLMQRPTSLDSACVLAQLQEEVIGESRRASRRFDRAPMAGVVPLPAPPLKPSAVEDRRVAAPSYQHNAVDKYHDLRAQRRAQGLCVRCAAKWSRDHKCPDLVQLHIVQELCDLFPEGDDDKSTPQPTSPTNSQIMAHL
jgi:hypothetical protein